MQQNIYPGTATSATSTTRSVLQRMQWISPAQRLSTELANGQPLPTTAGVVSGEERELDLGERNIPVDVDEEGVVAFTQRTVRPWFQIYVCGGGCGGQNMGMCVGWTEGIVLRFKDERRRGWHVVVVGMGRGSAPQNNTNSIVTYSNTPSHDVTAPSHSTAAPPAGIPVQQLLVGHPPGPHGHPP